MNPTPIRSVESDLLSYVFPEPIEMPFYGGLRTILKRDAMLIRVKSANGLTGYAPGPASESARDRIAREIAPFLEGRDASDPGPLRRQFTEAARPDEALSKLYGCVEVALYDLAGKVQDRPVSELLGGRLRDRIKLYGSAGMYQSPEGYAREAAAILGLGFPAYKMRPAAGPEQDLETVRQMRRAAGPGPGLMIDAHAWWRMGDRSYTPELVEQLARDMASIGGITWIEEPLPPEDHHAYLRLREKNILPVAGGEHEPDEEGFLDLVHRGCVDYVQMDVVCQGGYGAAARIFSAIGQRGLRFAFHSWGNDLEVIAAAHLGICWPETVVEWLEYPCYANQGKPGMYPFPLANEILTEPLAIESGDLIVPRQPGFGVNVDERVIERYPWVPGPWSYFRIDSPPETLAVTADHSVKWAGR